MNTIVIGAEEEYGRRLLRFLESRLRPDDCLFRYSDPEKFLLRRQEDALYIMTEEFFERIPDTETPGHRMIRICSNLPESDQEAFQKYDDPEILLSIIQRILHEHQSGSHIPLVSITAYYSPVYLDSLHEKILASMNPGELYLGMEDMKESGSDGPDMGDLCYYIRLGREDVLEKLRTILRTNESGCYYLESPVWYYDLAELEADHYRWFFAKLRGQDQFQTIYVAIGNGFVSEPSLLRLFDRVILIDPSSSHGAVRMNERLESLFQGEKGDRGFELIRKQEEELFD